MVDKNVGFVFFKIKENGIPLKIALHFLPRQKF